MGFQRLFVCEGPSVDAGHHPVAGVPPPIGPGDAAQLEGVPGDVLGGLHMGAFAHVQEGAVAVEGKLLQAVLFDQLRAVLTLVWLPHLVDALQGGGGRQVLPIKALTLLEDPPHALLDFGEVRLGKLLAQDEVVVEAVLDGRAEPKSGAGPQLQHRLRQHMGQAVANPVQLIIPLLIAVVFKGSHAPPAQQNLSQRHPHGAATERKAQMISAASRLSHRCMARGRRR